MRRVSKPTSTCCRKTYSCLPHDVNLMSVRLNEVVVSQASADLCYFGDYQGGDSQVERWVAIVLDERSRFRA